MRSMTNWPEPWLEQHKNHYPYKFKQPLVRGFPCITFHGSTAWWHPWNVHSFLHQVEFYFLCSPYIFLLIIHKTKKSSEHEHPDCLPWKAGYPTQYLVIDWPCSWIQTWLITPLPDWDPSVCKQSTSTCISNSNITHTPRRVLSNSRQHHTDSCTSIIF